MQRLRDCRFARPLAFVWLIACLAGGGYLFTKPVAEAHSIRAPRQVTKAIEDIKVGDWVLAKDPSDLGLPTPHRVIALPRNWTEHVVHVRVAGGAELQATRGHPFWVEAKGWTNALIFMMEINYATIRGVRSPSPLYP